MLTQVKQQFLIHILNHDDISYNEGKILFKKLMRKLQSNIRSLDEIISGIMIGFHQKYHSNSSKRSYSIRSGPFQFLYARLCDTSIKNIDSKARCIDALVSDAPVNASLSSMPAKIVIVVNWFFGIIVVVI